jgi:hypothetical protein
VANPKGTPENLRPAPPWPKGVSGNPSGRPKAFLTAELLKAFNKDPKAAANFIATGMASAKAGDFNFWKYLWERIEGKLPEGETPDQLTMEELARRILNKRAERRAAKRSGGSSE